MRRTKWLRRRAADRRAPTIRLIGGGTFHDVLWVGVETESERVFRQVARAAGAARRGFQPHLTVARWRSGASESAAPTPLLDGYSGPWFTPDAVVLMRSENQTYTTVDRLPLARD